MSCKHQSSARQSCQHGMGINHCHCNQDHQFSRQFQTREEKITQLNTYLSNLQAEINAVNEHIERLQAE